MNLYSIAQQEQVQAQSSVGDGGVEGEEDGQKEQRYAPAST